MSRTKVTATRDFSHPMVGSRETDEQFDYDLKADPAGIGANGFVVEAKARAEAGEPAKKD